MAEDLIADTAQDSQNSGYQVLARKYRPQTFAELIGQEPMVRTLKNAIDADRLAHAFVLTGVRGIGKTTTARLIARALNCIGPDGQGGPTVAPCGVCEHCVAIAESRHVDVLEMDAASRTGVDDIREIIDGARYAASSARFKIYIIDEVHMLSKSAFNALLKTLEEPPAHVKFLFATTEIRKVPITVLSRCQRFDLRRVEGDTLTAHFAAIAEKEAAQIEDEALSLIARAADGSVRDGLSLLDQAIAHGAGTVGAEQVRDMLGLADRVLIFDLFEALMGGDLKAALMNARSQYNAGADPLVLLQDLLDLTHLITQLKTAPEASAQGNLPEAEASRGGAMAEKLSIPQLTRTWQLLLKGLEEVRMAPNAMPALEMVLIRLAHLSDLPSPGDLVRQLAGKESATQPAVAPAAPPSNPAPSPAPSAAASAASPEPPADYDAGAPPPGATQAQAAPAPQTEVLPQPQSFTQVVALASEQNELLLAHQLTDNVHLVRFRPGHIELRLGENAKPDIVRTLGEKLQDWTGARWVVSLTRDAEGEETLYTQQQNALAAAIEEVSGHPLVQQTLEAFPGAQILQVKDLDVAPTPAPPEDDDDDEDEDA